MGVKRKLLIVMVLAAAMVLLFAGQSLAGPPDAQKHWAEKQINNWVEKGYISGYPDGSFKPENSITRAEFITMVNNAFGKTAPVQVSYPDVSAGDWFAAGVARAVAAGYISGYNDGTFRPNDNIQRQEAAVIISKLLNLDISADTGVLSQFTDYRDIPQWSKGYIEAAVAGGYMSGYPDQAYRPAGYITRAEAVSTLDRALTAAVKTVTYDKMGTYGPADGVETINGGVTVSASGVTLQNTMITGNLFLAESIGDGDVTLKNVIVQGNTVIKGGGSQSVVLENCSLPNITVAKEGVRVVASGNTSVNIVRLESGATLVEVSISGPGFETVTVTEILPAGAAITLDGNFEKVNVDADEVRLEIAGGTVTSMDIAETAAGTVIDLAAGAEVNIMTLNAAVSVTGEGTIETAIVNVSGSTFEQEPDKIEKADGVTVGTGAAGGGGTATQTITISDILATNTLGKFKFDTDTVTTLEALEGKILAGGVDAINIAKRNSGEDGKVWNAYIATTPYEYDIEYVITCESPFVISGNDIVMWSRTAPAVANVNADDIDDNGNGADLEVSFDAADGENTRIDSYRVIVVKSGDASSFDLAEANAADYYTAVAKTGADSYTITLDAGASDVDGDAVTEDVAYKVFVLSIADGSNATENALSPASASITLSSGGGGGSQTITISNILTTNTLGKFKFDTDTATTGTALEGKIIAGGADAVDLALRGGDATGTLWNAYFAATPEYNTEYEITCESPFTISGSGTVMWAGDTTAPAATGVTASDVADNGNGSDLEVSFTRPSGENTKIASYRIMVVKSAAASSFDLSVADSVYGNYYTTVDKTGAATYTTTLASDAKDIDGDSITADTAYKVFVLSVADGINATVNALSDVSNEVTLSGGGEPPAAAPVYSSSEVTTQGDVSIYFDKAITDPTGIGSESQFTVKVNDVAAEISYVSKTSTSNKIKIVLAVKITSGQVVTVAYTKGDIEASRITSTDGGVLETFEAQAVTNGL